MTIASKIKDLNIYSSIFRLFALGIPFYLFIIYLIMYEIKLINGICLIHLKITYLSICMAEIIIRNDSYAIDGFKATLIPPLSPSYDDIYLHIDKCINVK